ncbi:uncharacterized protein A4U43_C09F1790 [Asparagus officinalis]|uniref:Uncharacterized protein n=1 Tax=Asparagus officinalis TaxID=4686 RepID=A0A5P1E4J4_ASPOF|nr:abscisic stress-ripening protein 2-like [Asparagus officinalis]ONK57564.1 uncharacterized protein A4U43_C09F1790 [Asparagus officinalis]
MAEEKEHHHLFHHHQEGTPAEELKHHKHKEHLGEMGAVTAGAFALYEKHESKKDPEHAHKHKIEEEVAVHEKHEKKEAKKEEKAEGGKKHHHLF